ncbi:DUF2513 domain-containing protein [Oceanobacillus oncorhynchi]|uniref:DUF2513 domain-containing protein n=1 Tax=Oceanobacillus oncorhynchi TaxID=545501 RepID=UPI002115F2B5|nr:DUF2513 domain-containing protein [Oceanobacillus oncorhynchi]UUI41143.1 DUF2513 domain-containing protein [Oceanobacillus oncorhynchi]
MVINYFSLYQAVIETIETKKPGNGSELFNSLTDNQLIKTQRSNGISDKDLIDSALETVDNLLDDNLVKGKKVVTKDGNLYTFKGLTTSGHQYLASLEKPEFKEKVKQFLKEEGIPINPQSISKAIFQFLF